MWGTLTRLESSGAKDLCSLLAARRVRQAVRRIGRDARVPPRSQSLRSGTDGCQQFALEVSISSLAAAAASKLLTARGSSAGVKTTCYDVGHGAIASGDHRRRLPEPTTDRLVDTGPRKSTRCSAGGQCTFVERETTPMKSSRIANASRIGYRLCGPTSNLAWQSYK